MARRPRNQKPTTYYNINNPLDGKLLVTLLQEKKLRMWIEQILACSPQTPGEIINTEVAESSSVSIVETGKQRYVFLKLHIRIDLVRIQQQRRGLSMVHSAWADVQC